VVTVSISTDGGHSWIEAKLGKDFGRYSFREWTVPFTLAKKGIYDLKVRAVNRIGQEQPLDPLWNSAGYMRNVVETTHVVAI
jgi:sulfite dehydrogenase